MAGDPEGVYYQSVEEYFVSRRGAPLVLSNADWTLVRKWRVAGVPLRVVLRGIRDAMDAHDHGFNRDRKVGSLGYCAREVGAARERWERALGMGSEPDASKRALITFAEQLEAALGLGPRARSLADRIARELREGECGRSLASVTGWLGSREDRLVAALVDEDGDALRREREAEVEEGLRPWRSRMPGAVLDHIRREAITRRVLEAHGLPRLSLFHREGGGVAS